MDFSVNGIVVHKEIIEIIKTLVQKNVLMSMKEYVIILIIYMHNNYICLHSPEDRFYI